MQPANRRMISVVALWMLPLAALAQQSPPAPAREVPPPEQLEPGVNTSAAAPASPAAVSPNTDTGKTQAHGAAVPSAQQEAPAAAASRKEAAGKPAPRKAGPDRLQLDATDITGNRELPKVLYIVPWKRSDLGDLVGKPPNSLLDEVLQPVDRDVFKRENRYYDALKPDTGEVTPGAPKNP